MASLFQQTNSKNSDLAVIRELGTASLELTRLFEQFLSSKQTYDNKVSGHDEAINMPPVSTAHGG